MSKFRKMKHKFNRVLHCSDKSTEKFDSNEISDVICKEVVFLPQTFDVKLKETSN